LTPVERLDLWRYLVERRALGSSDRNTPVFIQSDDASHFDRSEVSLAVSRVMASELGHSGWTFHHLRHSAVNAMAATLLGISRLSEQLSGWTAEQASTVRSSVYTKSHDKRDAFWALAVFTGHSDPGQTFQSYFHIVPDIAAELRAGQTPLLSSKAVAAVTRLEPANLAPNQTQSELLLKLQQRHEALKAIERFAASLAGNANLAPEPKKPRGRRSKYESPQFEAISYAGLDTRALDQFDCLTLLKSLGDKAAINPFEGAPPEQARQINKWITSAKSLAEITSQKGARRNRVSDPLGGYVPVWPRQPEDKKLMDSIMYWLKFNDAKAQNEKELATLRARIWCALALKGATGSRAGIRFNEPNDLAYFLANAPTGLDSQRWRLELSILKGAHFDQRLQAWHDAAKVIRADLIEIPFWNSPPTLKVEARDPIRPLKNLGPGTVYAFYELNSQRANGSGTISRETAVALRAGPYVGAVYLGMKASDVELGRRQPGYTRCAPTHKHP
jgi:hypothetical protein